MRYDYDNLDRVSKIYYNNTVACTYSYNAEGYMSEVVDYKAHIKVKYEYDTHGRNTVTTYFTFSGTNASSCEIGYAVYVDYDNIGRVHRIIYAFAGSTGSSDQLYYFPEYVDDSSIIKKWNVSINDSVDRYLHLGNDGFGRATMKNIVIDSNTLLETQYTYDSVETEDEVYDPESEDYVIQSLTSDRIILYKNTYKKRISTGTNTEKQVSTSYNYSYDANGNITGIYKYCTETNYTNGNRTSTSRTIYHTRYTYDYLNQLIREDDEEAGYSYTYSYDNAGNRTSKKVYAYTVGTLGSVIESYGYSYSSGDRLITDGCSNNHVTYDSIGNPTRFTDVNEPENYYTDLTWDGRQLTTIFRYSCGDEQNIIYTYNADGIRTSKEYDDVCDTGILYRWEYDLSGSTIIRAKYYNDDELTAVLLFFYDDNGSPFGMSVKSANSGSVQTYYYEKNLQGDIVGIMNEAGYRVVSYTYDAWGNPYDPVYSYNSGVSSTDRNYAQLNPFRYRGYYYDVETGYYYLQTRYYNPEWGRFLNADGYLNANGDILGYNMFAYCGNNPVMGYDPEGTFNLDKFFNGGMLLAIGALTVAAAISVASCGAATPLVIAVAAVAFAAGAATAVNGASDIVESVTDYNPVRDTIFAGDEEQYLQYEMQMALGSQLGASAMYGLTDGGNNVCFKSGTLVSAENGDVAIENIKVGDLVWATDEETGETSLKEVVQTFRNETEEWVHVKVNGEEITCTPMHPFYSPVKGWTSAIDLRAGDILVMLNGEYVVVEQVQHELLESPETTYNFEVEDYHTYYVGNTAVLVHNKCGEQFDENQSALLKLAKENKNGVTLSDAKILVDWANEYGISNHGPQIHVGRSGIWGEVEHIKIKNIHIPIIGG